MLEKIKDRLCAEARYWFKMWSTWLAVIYGTIATAFWNDPSLFGAIASALPPSTRVKLSPLVFFLTTGVPIIVRMLKQHKLSEQANAAAAAEITKR